MDRWIQGPKKTIWKQQADQPRGGRCKWALHLVISHTAARLPMSIGHRNRDISWFRNRLGSILGTSTVREGYNLVCWSCWNQSALPPVEALVGPQGAQVLCDARQLVGRGAGFLGDLPMKRVGGWKKKITLGLRTIHAVYVHNDICMHVCMYACMYI